jgi:mannitol/fructose-specific phosphotransferase system IIA component (Ntr-type)
MKLSELLSEELVIPSLKGTDIASVLREFAETIRDAGKFSDSDTIFQKLLDREKQESTGIGKGLAIPHCKVEELPEVILAVGYSERGVNFRSIDGELTYFFFVVISPASASVLHLRVLAALSRLLRSRAFLSALQQRPGRRQMIDLMKREEEDAAVTP